MSASASRPRSHSGSSVGSGLLPRSTSLHPNVWASSRAAAAVTPLAPPDRTITSSLPSSRVASPETIALGESSRVTRPVVVRPTSSGPSRKISSTTAFTSTSSRAVVTSMALQCTSGHSRLAVLVRPASPPLAGCVSGPMPFNPKKPSRRDTVTKTEPLPWPLRRSARATRLKSVSDWARNWSLSGFTGPTTTRPASSDGSSRDAASFSATRRGSRPSVSMRAAICAERPESSREIHTTAPGASENFFLSGVSSRAVTPSTLLCGAWAGIDERVAYAFVASASVSTTLRKVRQELMVPCATSGMNGVLSLSSEKISARLT